MIKIKIFKYPKYNLFNFNRRIEINITTENKIEYFNFHLYNVNGFGNIYTNSVFALHDNSYSFKRMGKNFIFFFFFFFFFFLLLYYNYIIIVLIIN